MKRLPRFLRTVAFATACTVAFATGAAAQVVEIPEAPIGEEDFSTGRSSGGLLAALPPTSRDTAAGLQGDVSAPPAGSIYRLDPAHGLVPVTIAAGSGSETRLGVDVTVANAASEGWPWYGKAALIVGCVALAGLATWAIVEASNSGGNSSGDDSSKNTTINMHDNNSVTIRYFPIATPSSTSTTSTQYGGEW